VVVPIRDHAFFEQAVLQQNIRQSFLESAHLAAQVLNLAGGCLALGIARQPLLAGFQELLRPLVIEALCDAFAPAQLGDGIFAALSPAVGN